MTVPGSNLLRAAFSVIGTQKVLYRQNNGRTKNAQLQWVSGYDAPFDLQGSVQRVRRDVYRQYNLDMQRNYVQLYANFNMVDLGRDVGGDQFVYTNRVYQLQTQGTWYPQDGWSSVLAVDVGPAQLDPLDGKWKFPNV